MITASDFISLCEKHFGTRVSAPRCDAAPMTAALAADFHACESGRSLGIFFPYDDYYFFHDFSGRDTESRRELEELHETARSYVNTLYRFPRWMRYRVPNISTVAISDKGFGTDCQRYVHSLKPVPIGGEIHSVFLVDLLNRRLVSAGLEVTAVEMVAITFKKVNPHNRAHGRLMEICAEYFSGRTSG